MVEVVWRNRESLIQAGIPYKVYGGLRFFERAEIKDALGYLRLIGNRDDDAAFERVVNQPTRGIGDRTLSQLRIYAKEHHLSLWASAKAIINNDLLTPRASSALSGFLELIEKLDESAFDLSLDELAQEMLQTSTLLDHYRNQRHEKARAKVENLEELVTATKHFEPEDDRDNPLQAFLTHAALESGEAQSNAYEDAVQMMTLHSAKGLEFPLVFMVGMEEGLFPHQLSIEEPGRLEEERRLCYVGMTRAMRTLYFTYAEIRRLHGKEEYHKPSRFIQEVSDEFIVEVRKPSKVYRPSLKQTSTSSIFKLGGGKPQHESGFKLGQLVRHAKFGDGVVLGFEGQGPQTRIEVKFNQVGIKWLVLAYAKLEVMC